MLEPQELSGRLADCSQGKLSLGDFEDWFVRNSWNVHQSEDDNLIHAAFAIEELLSAEANARIDTATLLRRFRQLALLLVSELLFVKTESISRPQQITVEWGASYEDQSQVISTSVSVPETLELSRA
jgi:hypothetical protein